MAITVKTRKTLWGKSGNRCSFPGCKLELCLPMDSNGHLTFGEECHIVAKSKKGCRGKSKLSSKQRDKYENLILLCERHHTEIDNNEKKYTVDRLKSMRTKHENWVKEKLSEDEKLKIEFDYDDDDLLSFNDEYLSEVVKWIEQNLGYEYVTIDRIKESIIDLMFLGKKDRKMLVRLINFKNKRDEIHIPSIYNKLLGDGICNEAEFFNSIVMLEKYDFIEFDDRFEVFEDEDGNAVLLQGPTKAKYMNKDCDLGLHGFTLSAISAFLDDKKMFKALVVDGEYEIL